MSSNEVRTGERAVRGYQRSRIGRRLGGHCRFEPSCSEYSAQAFATRALPTACFMTLSRLLRCNPLARAHTHEHHVHDPVQRAGHRHAPRRNTLRTLFATMMLAGFVMIFFAGSAPADPISGGCTGGANGRDAASLTKSNPLVVKKSTNITARGEIPAAQQGQDPTSLTKIEIELVDGLPTFGEDRTGTGDTWASKTVKVDDYFSTAGLYKVKITNSGPGWTCSFVGYVEVDENPLSTPVGITAAAFTVIGAIGAASAGLPSNGKAKAIEKAKEEDSIQYADNFEPGTADYYAAQTMDYIAEPGPFWFPCFVMPLLLPLTVMPIFGASGGGGTATTTAIGPGSRTVRVKGRPIAGFFGGLLFALGVVVLLQQYSVWTLTIFNVIVAPIVVAILFMISGLRGRRYKVTRRSTTPPAAETAPPTTTATTEPEPAQEPAPAEPPAATAEAEPPPAPPE